MGTQTKNIYTVLHIKLSPLLSFIAKVFKSHYYDAVITCFFFFYFVFKILRIYEAILRRWMDEWFGCECVYVLQIFVRLTFIWLSFLPVKCRVYSYSSSQKYCTSILVTRLLIQDNKEDQLPLVATLKKVKALKHFIYYP